MLPQQRVPPRLPPKEEPQQLKLTAAIAAKAAAGACQKALKKRKRKSADAFLPEGEVAADVQAKVHQLAADIESRNFHGASAVQAVSHVARAIFAIDT